MSIHRNSSIKPQTNIVRGVLIESLPQHDLQYRPFQGHLTGETLEEAQELTEGGRSVNATRLARVASRIISPSSEGVGRVEIPNGMREKRFAFLLEVITTSVFDYGFDNKPPSQQREIIRGFTDYDGVNDMGDIDPDMKFYFSSRIVVQEQETVGHRGTGFVRRLKDNQSVLATATRDYDMRALRPEDVACYKHMHAIMHSEGIQDRAHDGRTMLAAKPLLASRMHTLPSRYLADICRGYSNANAAEYFSDDDDGQDYADLTAMYDNVIGSVAEGSLQLSPFFKCISSGRPAIDKNMPYCTFDELDELWPDVHWETICFPSNQQVISLTDNMEHWEGGNMETLIAYTLSHVIPSIMTEFMIVRMDVVITNETVGNRPDVRVSNPAGIFEDIITYDIIDRLEGTLLMEVALGILDQKATTYSLDMRIDLLSNSTYTLSLNDQPFVDYSAPMFCDSYYSPLIGQGDRNLDTLSKSVEPLALSLCSRDGRDREFRQYEEETPRYSQAGGRPVHTPHRAPERRLPDRGLVEPSRQVINSPRKRSY